MRHSIQMKYKRRTTVKKQCICHQESSLCACVLNIAQTGWFNHPLVKGLSTSHLPWVPTRPSGNDQDAQSRFGDLAAALKRLSSRCLASVRCRSVSVFEGGSREGNQTKNDDFMAKQRIYLTHRDWCIYLHLPPKLPKCW